MSEMTSRDKEAMTTVSDMYYYVTTCDPHGVTMWVSPFCLTNCTLCCCVCVCIELGSDCSFYLKMP